MNDTYVNKERLSFFASIFKTLLAGKANKADVTDELNDKLDKPSTAGTANQVLTNNGSGGQTWADPVVTDVQINSTSILNNGVANVPIAVNLTTPGVVIPNVDDGIGISSGKLFLSKASDAQVKGGNNQYKAITPVNQHTATFYGLAKAAGDTTQSASSNAVGTYTDSAKSAIKTMLGVTDPVTPSFSIGTVTTGVPNSNAAASITGTDASPVLNLTIPAGNSGVYIGSTAPTDPNVNVWIDTTGSSWEDTMIQTLVDRILALYPAAEGVSF